MSVQWLWPRDPEGWTVVDCQGGLFAVSVKLPTNLNDRAVVQKHVSLPGAKIDQVNLSYLMKQLNDQSFPLLHILGRKEYQMFLVEKAAVKPEEMQSSLRWTVSPLLDYPAVDANLSWMEIPQWSGLINRTPELYVITARSELIKERMDEFEQAKLTMKVFDIRETGQRNISAALKDQEAAVCLIYAESDGVQLTVTYKGELHLERYIRESLFDDDENSQTNITEKKFDRVALEVQRSIDFVHRNASYMPFDGIFIGPTEKNIGLREKLQSRLLTDVNELDLSTLFEWPADSDLVVPEVQAKYFNALGASLRLKN